MTGERLNQIQNALAELIRIVGNTNAAVEELRVDVAELKTDVAELKTDVAELKTDVAELKTDVAELKTDVAELKTDVAELKANQQRLEKNQQVLLQNQQALEAEFFDFKEETVQKLNSLNVGIEYLANKLVKHDMQLFEYKRLAK